MCLRIVRRACHRAIVCAAIASLVPASAAIGQDLKAARVIGNDVKASSPRSETHKQQVKSGDIVYNIWRLEFASPDQCKAAAAQSRDIGVHTVSAFDRYWCFLQKRGDDAALGKIDALRQNGLVWWELEDTQFVPPPPPDRAVDPRTPQLRASEPTVRGGITVDGKTYTGKGVVIAVIDSGCDFRQPDFIVNGPEGKTSRFLYFWDTYSTNFDQNKGGSAPPIDFKFPNGSSVGTLYTRDHLNAELRSGRNAIPDPDENGHGTGCAGVAASNGNGLPESGKRFGKYAGVAPEADLIGIRISNPRNKFQNSFLLGVICEFLQKVAGDRPLVVTCSFGGQYGGRDGFMIKERELAARFPLSGAGRAICFAAGNEREDGLHSRITLSPGEKKTVSWVLDSDYDREKNNAKGVSLELYIDGLQNPGKDILFGGVKEIGLKRNPLSKTAIFEFNGEREGSFAIKNGSSDPIAVDSYIYTNPGGFVRFTPDTLSMQRLIDSPGCSPTALTIGSYDFNNEFSFNNQTIFVPVFPWGITGQAPAMKVGQLSAYSSPGPLRKGGDKPDLAAPGQWHVVPAVANHKARFEQAKAANKFTYPVLVDTSGQYKLFNGTSAATPYTAGVVALMFEKNPKLPFGNAKEILHNAVKEPGKAWDQEYGYGKLTFEAVVRAMRAVP